MPDKKRCFVIMPFTTPDGYEKDHFTKIYEQIIEPAIKKADLEPKRVDQDLLSTDIVAKIFEGLTECEMAICDLSSRNPNVLYELGIRQAYNKPVLLIKDEKTEKIFDVGGLTTIPYESNRLYENVTDAVDRISQALIENLLNKESVVDIIRVRLGNDFKASEIPTNQNMNKDDKIISLLSSLIDDVDLIKKQMNNKWDSEAIYKNTVKNMIKYSELKKYNDSIDKMLIYKSLDSLQKNKILSLRNKIDNYLNKGIISESEEKEIFNMYNEIMDIIEKSNKD